MRDISMHILDIVQNSISAKASLINISVTIDTSKDLLTIRIDDNGFGMSDELLKRVTSPFATSRVNRNVGLGIPLFAASCERTGKKLYLESSLGLGTKLTAEYLWSHIDRPPLGDIAQTVYVLTLMNPDVDFVFTAKKSDEFEYDTRLIKETLGGVPIDNSDVAQFINEFLSEGIKEIFGGKDL